MKTLIIILLAIVTLASCARPERQPRQIKQRAIDVITNVPMPVVIKDRLFYKKGDTVWVDLRTSTVTPITHFKTDPTNYRKFVLQ